MLSYIKGTFAGLDDEKIIIENNGLGYEITAPTSVLARLPERGEEIKLYVYEVIKEDTHELIGFTESEQKKIFMKLLSISGMGPKGAVSVLSVLSPRELIRAVAENDFRAIARANGVGTKMAQKVVIELKGKVDRSALDEMNAADVSGVPDNPIYSEALQALVALGYQQNEAKLALKDVEAATSREMIRKALSKLGSRV